MRCADVIHELAVPTGNFERAILVEHLDHCPSCARWAERNARLDQVWAATRAPELSAAAWDRIWANVSESLDQPQVMAPAPFAPVILPRPLWRRSAVAVFVLAQAAAILAGLGLAWHQAPSSSPAHPQPRPMAVATAPAVELSDMVFNLSSTGTSVISFDDKTLRNLALNENPYEVDPLFNGFNDLESQAGLQ
ncbi:hypothetical protein [Singulisphaera acidiphila]|uniref:Zinc-finger domain-containing protein n=1 Tax=Singulisphaera acidiphila (strain ATCC BAA-1392 / DSM 18658 / VKM B-2454 / MOB10) TaxID=886293 RepID=L0D681_SINAD|nr:hypothetical protein [Singulisphaera acidiphila]AGA24772.1 hypothetical protein Sinac_0329 [Singulisphaera acidiphila DSM 18658]